MSVFAVRQTSMESIMNMKNGLRGLLGCLVLATGAASAEITFEDRTGPGGFTFSGESYGASWGELNGDGYPDLFTNRHRQTSQLYLNDGDGTFSEKNVWVFANRPNADTHGGAWADFDGDGDQDLFVTTGIQNANQFFRNNNGNLNDASAEFNILLTTKESRMPIWHDYDRDGNLDFILATSRNTEVRRQNDSGVFVDTRQSTNMRCDQAHYGQLSDLDLDGIMEFICSETTYPQRIYDQTNPRFVDVTSQLETIGSVGDVVIADFNGDLRPDIFRVRGSIRPSGVGLDGNRKLEAALSQNHKGFSFQTTGNVSFNVDFKRFGGDIKILVGPNKMQKGDNFTLNPNTQANRGAPTYDPNTQPGIYIWFEPASNRWFVRQASAQLGATGFTFAHFLISSTANISAPQSFQFGFGEVPINPNMQFNFAPGWENRTFQSGLASPISCGGATHGDFDNDMDVDLYLTCRTGVSNLQNRLYENNGNGMFTLVANAGGAAGPVGAAVGSGAGTAENAVVADYDLDGYLDLFVTNGNNLRPVRQGGPEKLFRNTGSGNNWLMFDLVGNGSNTATDAIGAKVFVTAGGVTQLREQNGGYHRWSQDHQRIHFGLKNHTTADVEIRWPNGTVQTYTDVAASGLYRAEQAQGGSLTLVKGSDGGPDSPCAPPSYDPGTQVPLVVWQDCPLRTFNLRMAGASSFRTYTGRVVSDMPLSDVTPFSQEAADIIDNVTDPNVIEYSLSTGGTFEDGFSFSYPPGATVCIDADQAEASPVTVGAGLNDVMAPFNIMTLEPCDLGPAFSVQDASAAESTGQIEFTVTVSPVSDTDVLTIDYTTEDGDALDGIDYTFTSGQLTFQPFEASKTVTVPLIDNQLQEGDRSFQLKLSNAVNAGLNDDTGVGTILDDDVVADLTIDDVVASEGEAMATFTVTLSAIDSDTVTVDYATMDVSAVAGQDYVAANGTLTFDPGVTERTVDVMLIDDADLEGSESFRLDLSNAVNATLVDNSGDGTIGDNEIATCGMPNPPINLNNEREAFLYKDCSSNVWYARMTAGGISTVYRGMVDSSLGFTSVVPFDFEQSDSLTVGPNSFQYELRMGAVYWDGFDFEYPVGSSVCFGLDSPAGTQVLVGPDRSPVTPPFDPETLAPCGSALPAISIGNASAGETDGTMDFLIDLDRPSTVSIAVDFATSDGTATAGADYGSTSGILVFAAGETSKTVTVAISDDSDTEGDETFTVALTNPSNAQIIDASGQGTIIDDDVIPAISVSDAQGDEQVGQLFFAVTLSSITSGVVSVDFATSDGSATDGSDYLGATGTLTFNPGETQQNISVTIEDDGDIEGSEDFQVTLSSPVGATLADAIGQGTILDDDGAICGDPNPAINLNNERAAFLYRSCSNGLWNARFTAGGSFASYQGTVESSLGFTVTQPFDFEGQDSLNQNGNELTYQLGMGGVYWDGFNFDTPAGSSICFGMDQPAGSVVLVGPDRTPVSVPFNPDTLGPCVEGPPVLSVADTSVSEGVGTAAIEVTLTPAATVPVTVSYQTVAGTAAEGADYQFASGSLTFQPGEVSQSAMVTIVDDTDQEGSEIFQLTLSNPSGATIGQGTADINIADNEGIACGLPNPAVNLNNEKAIFVFQDCTSNVWRLLGTAGGTFSNYGGQIQSSAGFASVAPFDYESNDVLNQNGNTVSFDMRMGAVYADGVDFEPNAGATVCIDITKPGSPDVFLGPDRLPVGTTFDLSSGGPCP